MEKLIIRYEHVSSDLSTAYIGVAPPSSAPREWLPAYRDTERGVRVLFVRVPAWRGMRVWVRDKNGTRRVNQEDILST